MSILFWRDGFIAPVMFSSNLLESPRLSYLGRDSTGPSPTRTPQFGAITPLRLESLSAHTQRKPIFIFGLDRMRDVSSDK